jgi:hypothetical protein
VDILLVNVNGRSERAADGRERELKTVQASESDSDSGSKRGESAKKRDRVVPRPIRTRHRVQAPREIPAEVILQEEHRDKPGSDDSGRG